MALGAAAGTRVLITLLPGAIGLDRPAPARRADVLRIRSVLDGPTPRLWVVGRHRVSPQAIPLSEAEVPRLSALTHRLRALGAA